MISDRKSCFTYENPPCGEDNLPGGADNLPGGADGDERVKITSYEFGADKRYTVLFENGAAGGFSEEEFFAFGLYATGEALPCSYRELEEKVNRRRAYGAAVSFLRGSLKPERQVTEKLSEEGFSEETAEETVRQLREEGVLDDEKYGMRLVKKRLEAGNTSCLALTAELRGKGLSGETAARCLAALAVDDGVLAEKIIAKKLKMGDGPEKIRRYLAGKGFPAETVRRAFKKFELRGTEDPGGGYF